AIPTKFINNLRDKLTGTVALKGPSGNVWDVGLLSNGDTLFLRQGWRAFVEDHSLEEKDILIFKYNGNSRFDVLIFDQKSSCEREGSYFVKKCLHTESECGSKRKRNIEKSYEETNNESSDDFIEYHQAIKQRSATTSTASRRQPTRATSRGGGRTMRGRRGSSSMPRMELESRRRVITDEEKERAQRLAAAAAAAMEDSFILVMRASHVYNRFCMSIPSEWLKKHHIDKSLDVELRVGEKNWVAKYYYKGYGGGLMCGWKKFVLENFLEEFDVCLFDLVSQKSDAIILDIKIFRVVEEVIPPSTLLVEPNLRGNDRRMTSNSHATSESEE
ncbi:hypothetical protein RD792_000157, partial [Penstemon davidsonii]